MIPLDTVGGVHVRKMLLGLGEAMEVILGASAGAAFRGEKGREEREGKRRKGRERMIRWPWRSPYATMSI